MNSNSPPIHACATYRTSLSRLLGVVVLAYVVACAPPAYFAHWVVDVGELAGFVLLSAAAFGRLWCLIYIAGRKSQELQTSGPYSIVRNPLYVFSFLGAVGFGLAVENPLLAILLAAAFAVYYPMIVRLEERRLVAVFGPAFGDYCSRTPRWLPDFSRYCEPDSLVVHPAKIRRGILDAMWFLLAFLLWEAVEELRSLALLPILN